MKVQVERFHLNGYSTGFRPQTQKLELPYNSIIHSGSERVNLLSLLWAQNKDISAASQKLTNWG